MNGNRLKTAMEKLRSRLREHASVNITVRGNGGFNARCAAAAGTGRFHSGSENGISVNAEYADFIVETADLPDDPEPGWTIEYDGRTYEICAPAEDVPCWRWSDSFHLARRIHARFTERESGA